MYFKIYVNYYISHSLWTIGLDMLSNTVIVASDISCVNGPACSCM